ncbi:Mn2+/Fe2+ transporter, NRAMP family [Hyphomonas neptunium ATCC 15444]|uniref:Mn2+/Fe2+ transporter, NRAMP family n=2 Tax=Hyphomonas TaxID=85 RepID=Q0C0C0_HYPNA|nr:MULTISPECIES: Nramp family divalent metal transporter [Hyphomonas]ABI77773.1 Mn2+/Fe2+ transporter, NRAMP family [Hyphomonas neptunium ATCC 15444]KCZ90596.1 Mn2+/Fe2+ transporter [Hyphomonas hirschiana VP5]
MTRKFSIGPGALVAAAFIGPGTVTACTLAGANFGFALVWALVFATFATIILQEMTVRLGILGGAGLGEALVAPGTPAALKWGAIVLVLAALALGNAAYEAGNITGGALGMRAILGEGEGIQRITALATGLLAALILLLGRYKTLERVLIGLVLLMSLAFAASLVLVRPDIGSMIGGLRPTLPDGSLLTAMALIGTTIVPYNLFLHAAAVRERWKENTEAGLNAAIADTRVSVGLGGLISILVLSTAAASLFGAGMVISSGADMASALEPAYGSAARILAGAGLCAAGLSSAITAPLATAYAVCEVTGRPKSGWFFKGIALAIVFIGLSVALLGIRPVELILIAQVANGLLLPVVAAFLLITMNRKSVLGSHTNGPVRNALGVLVVLVAAFLGLRLILRALGIWP